MAEKMSLSDAILLGSTMHPQAFHRYAMDVWVRDPGVMTYTCAIGAAATAIGKLDELRAAGHGCLVRDFPALATMAACPVCNGRSTMAAILIHLNDCHQWKREDIAAYVRATEPVVSDSKAAPEPAINTVSEEEMQYA